MSAAPTPIETRVKRCAVCKIDRKGRFILADHEAEKLFGLSEVKLFGQPFVEFLDPSDRDALEHMANDRNPYETVHDSARLTILPHKGERIPATVIVTVNFGGGNPANYQIVIVPEEATTEDCQPTASELWSTLTDLLQSEDEIDLSDLLELLRSLTDAGAIAVYAVDGSSRELQARTGQLPTSSADPDSANLEEIRASIGLSETRSGEICFFASPDSTALDACVRLAGLIHALRPPVATGPEPTGFSLGAGSIFDQAGMAAVVLDADLTLLGRNEAFVKTCRSLGADVDTAQLDLLLDRLDPKAADAVRVHFQAVSATITNPEFCVAVNPADGPRFWLQFRPMESETAETRWLMLVDQKQPAGSGLPDPVLVERGLSLVAEHIAAGLETAASLEDSYPKKGNGETDYSFACLGQHLVRSEAISNQMAQALKKCTAVEQPKAVLLSRMIARRTAALQEKFTERSLSIEATELPKIKTCGRALEAVLGELLEWWLCHTEAEEPLLKAAASTGPQTVTITMTDPVAGLTKRNLRRLFDLNNSIGLLTSERGRFDGRHLGFTRDRLQNLGGSLNIKPESDGSLVISLTVPTV